MSLVPNFIQSRMKKNKKNERKSPLQEDLHRNIHFSKENFNENLKHYDFILDFSNKNSSKLSNSV